MPGTLFLLLCCALAAFVADPARGATPQTQNWGAIATKDRFYGYANSYPSRAEAEHAAMLQCDRVAGHAGACSVRTYFDRQCSALAQGNYGEWGAAIEPTPAAANKAATGQCDAHLPAEPCKVVVSICSGR